MWGLSPFAWAITPFYRRNESIAASRKRLDITRSLGVIAQGFAQTLHRVVDAFIEFDEGIRGPEALLKLFFRNELPGFLEENQQDSKRLVLEIDAHAVLAHFAGAWVDLEDPES
jgi:hypothetical protein